LTGQRAGVKYSRISDKSFKTTKAAW